MAINEALWKGGVVRLHQVHALVLVLCEPHPVGHAGNTDFGQSHLDHGLDHRRNIADSKRLLEYHVWHQLVGVVNQL